MTRCKVSRSVLSWAFASQAHVWLSYGRAESEQNNLSYTLFELKVSLNISWCVEPSGNSLYLAQLVSIAVLILFIQPNLQVFSASPWSFANFCFSINIFILILKWKGKEKMIKSWALTIMSVRVAAHRTLKLEWLTLLWSSCQYTAYAKKTVFWVLIFER